MSRSSHDRSLAPPLVRAVTYRFESAAELERYNRGEAPELFMYGRYENPTVSEAEAALAERMGAEDCALFASGMAAATSAILAFAEGGQEVVAARTIYGGVYKFLRDVAPRWGLQVRWADGPALAEPGAINRGTRLVYVESPTNPMVRVLDVAAIAARAREAGAISVVDSTFAPPPLMRMSDLGTDLAVHSVTKYLNGHSDVLGGAVLGSRERVAPVKKLRRILGNNADPAAAWELLRGMQTLEVRLERQQRTAQALAERLAADKRVLSVSYPGLPSHPDHALAKRQLHGFGAMLTFAVRGGYPAAARIYDALGLIARAASLGSVESLCSLPAITSHAGMSEEELRAAGVDPGSVRISVGLEPAEALWVDLDQALARVVA